MGRTACTELQCLYNGALYLFYHVSEMAQTWWNTYTPFFYCFSLLHRACCFNYFFDIPTYAHNIYTSESTKIHINPLNAELNPICHLLTLLGDLTFIGPCIVSISKKMQRYTVYLYLETALHVSVGTSTHHQERLQLYLQHLVFVTPLLLSAAIVEELELVLVCFGWRTPPTAHPNRFQLFHDKGR
jgi:hypothetical protein